MISFYSYKTILVPNTFQGQSGTTYRPELADPDQGGYIVAENRTRTVFGNNVTQVVNGTTMYTFWGEPAGSVPPSPVHFPIFAVVPTTAERYVLSKTMSRPDYENYALTAETIEYVSGTSTIKSTIWGEIENTSATIADIFEADDDGEDGGGVFQQYITEAVSQVGWTEFTTWTSPGGDQVVVADTIYQDSRGMAFISIGEPYAQYVKAWELEEFTSNLSTNLKAISQCTYITATRTTASYSYYMVELPKGDATIQASDPYWLSAEDGTAYLKPTLTFTKYRPQLTWADNFTGNLWQWRDWEWIGERALVTENLTASVQNEFFPNKTISTNDYGIITATRITRYEKPQTASSFLFNAIGKCDRVVQWVETWRRPSVIQYPNEIDSFFYTVSISGKWYERRDFGHTNQGYAYTNFANSIGHAGQIIYIKDYPTPIWTANGDFANHNYEYNVTNTAFNTLGRVLTMEDADITLAADNTQSKRISKRIFGRLNLSFIYPTFTALAKKTITYQYGTQFDTNTKNWTTVFCSRQGNNISSSWTYTQNDSANPTTSSSGAKAIVTSSAVSLGHRIHMWSTRGYFDSNSNQMVLGGANYPASTAEALNFGVFNYRETTYNGSASGTSSSENFNYAAMGHETITLTPTLTIRTYSPFFYGNGISFVTWDNGPQMDPNNFATRGIYDPP